MDLPLKSEFSFLVSTKVYGGTTERMKNKYEMTEVSPKIKQKQMTSEICLHALKKNSKQTEFQFFHGILSILL